MRITGSDNSIVQNVYNAELLTSECVRQLNFNLYVSVVASRYAHKILCFNENVLCEFFLFLGLRMNVC